MNPEEVDLKGKPVEAIGVVDASENSFFIVSNGVTLFVRQPRPRDLKAMQEGMAKIDRKSWALYAPYSSIWENLHQTVALPIFERMNQSTLYMIMILDDEVVGFSSHEYRGTGKNRQVIGGLCISNPWRGRGVGSLYLKLSEYIAVFNGAREFHGQTRVVGGAYNIRMRDGWELVRMYDNKGAIMASIKRVLPRGVTEIRDMLIGEENCESPNS